MATFTFTFRVITLLDQQQVKDYTSYGVEVGTKVFKASHGNFIRRRISSLFSSFSFSLLRLLRLRGCRLVLLLLLLRLSTDNSVD